MAALALGADFTGSIELRTLSLGEVDFSLMCRSTPAEMSPGNRDHHLCSVNRPTLGVVAVVEDSID